MRHVCFEPNSFETFRFNFENYTNGGGGQGQNYVTGSADGRANAQLSSVQVFEHREAGMS